MPMFYQWKFNGTNVPGATSSHFSIPSANLAHAGSYSVLVSNHFGTALSIGASLTVQSGVGGGWVEWSNFNQLVNEGIYALVYGVDGVTLLEGPDFVAQPYVGATSNSLHAVGAPVSFMTGSEAGYYDGPPVSVPDVLSGQTGYVQVRVWNQNNGESFEEAAALGGEVGRSDVVALTLGQPFAVPPPLRGLWSFSLQAGQPLLAAAKLYPDEVLPDGSRKWLVIGDAGARYVVEYRTPPNDWTPLTVLTNVVGGVSFIDTNAPSASLKFYRAQIMDQ
jgi:hypothetical protein